MGNKVRLLAAVLGGLLVAVVVIRMQKGTMSIAGALVSANDVERNLALKKVPGLRGERREKMIGELAGTHAASDSAQTRTFALYALRKSGDISEPVVAALINGLGDADESVRREAEVGLREVGTPVLPALIARMDRPGVRSTAGQIMKVAQPDALAAVNEALSSAADERRLAAAWLLSRIERPETRDAARSLLPLLHKNLTSESPAVAVTAAFAANNLDPADPRPADVFLAQLPKDDWDAWDVRGWDALAALADMPTVYAKAVPVVTSLVMSSPDGLQKNRRFKRAALGAALEKMSPRRRDASGLAADLRAKDPVVRWRAAYVLSIAPDVDPAMMGPLVDALAAPDDATAARAFAALNVMGLEKTQRAAATVHPKLRAAFTRLDGKIPGFTDMAGPALEALGR